MNERQARGILVRVGHESGRFLGVSVIFGRDRLGRSARDSGGGEAKRPKSSGFWLRAGNGGGDGERGRADVLHLREFVL